MRTLKMPCGPLRTAAGGLFALFTLISCASPEPKEPRETGEKDAERHQEKGCPVDFRVLYSDFRTVSSKEPVQVLVDTVESDSLIIMIYNRGTVANWEGSIWELSTPSTPASAETILRVWNGQDLLGQFAGEWGGGRILLKTNKLDLQVATSGEPLVYNFIIGVRCPPK